MKRLYIIPFVISLLLIVGCEDLLNKENPNVPTTETFWNTPEDAEDGLTAAYHQLYQIGNFSRWIFFRYELAADIGYSQSPWIELADWTRFNYVNYNFWEGGVNIWRDHYKAIFRTNQVLANVPEIEFSDQTRKQQIIGEAKFLRALHYFNLAVLWEEVPVVLEPSNPDDQPEQRSRAEVWSQVKQDLQEAAEALPDQWPAEEVGRPTTGAALALLGKAHMQNQEWQEARNAMEWLVEGAGSQYYALVDNYHDNFKHTTENNVESVFEIQFSEENRGAKGDGSNSALGLEKTQFFAPRGIGWSDGQARRWLVDQYKEETSVDGSLDIRLKHNLFYREMGDDFENNDEVYGGPWREADWGDEVFIRKYQADYYRDNVDYYIPINFRVIRYADVLLSYAEIINELEGPQQAAQYVDRVRQRPSTNLAPLASSQYSDALTSRDAFRERLKMERALELSFEGVRWMDLKRWGMLQSQEGINTLQQRDPDFNNFELGTHHRLPIPQSEVENNPNLDQHPEY